MKLNIEAKLISKAFFGPLEEIGKGRFVESLHMPTLYTFAGTILFNMIQNLNQVRDFQEKIKKEEINFYGVYIKIKDEYYIPILYQLISENVSIIPKFEEIKNASSSSLIQLKRSIINYRMASKDKIYLVNIEKLINSKVFEFKVLNEERTRIKLQHPLRVVEKEKLFTLIYKDYEDKISFCLDIESSKNIELKDYIGNLGGEFTSAEFKINKDKSPLLDKIKGISSNIYLAVSHIPVKLENDKLISKFGEVEYLIGNVGYIGGWDLYSKSLKKVYATITPGSLFKVKDNKKFVSEEWYFNLLKTVFPIKKEELQQNEVVEEEIIPIRRRRLMD